MTYVTPPTLKKNSYSTSLTSGITAGQTTLIPIADCSACYDVSGALITTGWEFNPDGKIAQPAEETTVTACSVAYGTGGAGTVTLGARAVNYDFNTGGTAQGAAYAWPSGTTFGVRVSIGVYNALKAASDSLNTYKAPNASPTFTGTVTIPSANDSLVLSGTPPPNGSLLIGDGTGFRNAVLTAGSNVTITNAAGGITIAAAPGGVTFSGVSGTTQQAAVNNGYIPLNASLTTITLPATAAVGNVVAITGYGSGLWKLAQNASQLIYFNSLVTTTGTGGSIAATHQFDTVVVRCVVANTTWVVENAVGNLDVI